MKSDQVRRLKELEVENARLRRACVDRVKAELGISEWRA
jgi:hypothetical protein